MSAEVNTAATMEKITALAKNRGFIFPGSEIYGGLANTWDYGPLGVEFKNNIKDAWRRKFVHESKYNVGLDAAILMNPETWVASGHVGGFADPLIDCKACKSRFRADKLIEDFLHEQGQMDVQVDGWSNEKLEEFISENKIDGKYDVFAKQTITHAQYDFIPEGEEVKTIGVTATYIVSNSLSEEVVYNLTKALWESKADLLNAHSISSNMDVNRAFTTVGNVPVHPGAAKYYKELGQTVENIADIGA